MSDDSVFDLVGQPAFVFLMDDVDDTTTEIPVQYGAWDVLTQSPVVQVGSEWLGVSGVSDVSQPVTYVTADITADATTVSIADSSLFRADSSVGVLDSFAILGDSYEEFVVTDIIDGTTLAVTRSAPLAHTVDPQSPSGLSVTGLGTFYGSPQALTVTRGVGGTQATSHSRYDRITRVYRTADFQTVAAASVAAQAAPVELRLLVQAGADANFHTRLQAGIPRGAWDGGRSGEVSGLMPLPAGAVVQVFLDPAEAFDAGVDLTCTRLADGAGVVLDPAGTDSYQPGSVTGNPSAAAVMAGGDAATSDFSVNADGNVVVANAGFYSFRLGVYKTG